MIYLALALGFSFFCSILVVFACMRSSQLSHAENVVERPVGAPRQQVDEKGTSPRPGRALA